MKDTKLRGIKFRAGQSPPIIINAVRLELMLLEKLPNSATGLRMIDVSACDTFQGTAMAATGEWKDGLCCLKVTLDRAIHY